MNNKDLPAMPFEGGANNGMQPYSGLTKREYFAKDFACAYLSGNLAWSDGLNGRYSSPDPEDVAKEAIAYADALLDALDADMMLEGDRADQTKNPEENNDTVGTSWEYFKDCWREVLHHYDVGDEAIAFLGASLKSETKDEREKNIRNAFHSWKGHEKRKKVMK